MGGIAPMDDTAVAGWRKSRHSGGNGGNCVEVGQASARVVLLRDTTDRNGPLLVIPAAAWHRFTGTVR